MNQTTKTAMLNNDIYSSNGEKGTLEKFYDPDDTSNTDVMAQIQAQNVLSAVHHQFHQNQGKYIDLLSKLVECQATLLEKSQNSPALPKAIQNIEQILEILQINQSHYNANHEGYLQNQLALIRGGQFPTYTSNTLNDAPPSRVPNYPNTETETALPPSKKPEEQKSINASASQSASSVTTPPVTEQLPEVPPSSNTVNDAPPSRVSNYPITKPETSLSPSKKQEEQQSTDASASQSASSRPKSATAATLPKVTPTLQPIAITSETITAVPPKDDRLGSRGALEHKSRGEENTSVILQREESRYSVESTSFTNVPSTPPVAPEVSVPSTNSVDITKVSHRLLEVVSDKVTVQGGRSAIALL